MSGLHFGVRFWTPKRGPFCRQNFKVTGRKIARGSIVSARTRQKFPAAAFPWFCSAAGTCSPRPANNYGTRVLELGRPSVAGPVFARVFGPQTGVQKNHFFRSLEGAKSLENL